MKKDKKQVGLGFMEKTALLLLMILFIAPTLGADYYDPDGNLLPDDFVELRQRKRTLEDKELIEAFIQEGNYGFLMLDALPEVEEALTRAMDKGLAETLVDPTLNGVIVAGIMGELAEGYVPLYIDEMEIELGGDRGSSGELDLNDVVVEVTMIPSEDLATLEFLLTIVGEYKVEDFTYEGSTIYYNSGWSTVELAGLIQLTEPFSLALSSESQVGEYLVAKTSEGNLKLYMESFTVEHGDFNSSAPDAEDEIEIESSVYYEVYNSKGDQLYFDYIDNPAAHTVDLFGLF